MLKDWRKGIDTKGGDLKAQQDEARDLVARFFAGGDAADNAAKAKAATSPKDELLSNRDSLIALDKSLRSVGLSLAAFAYPLRLRALQPGERRYPLEKKMWAEEMQSSIDRDRRACVVDEGSGKRRLEAPAQRAQMRLLFCCLDRGPCSWPAMAWLFQSGGAWGCYTPDPCHLIWSDVKCSVKRSGLWQAYLEGNLLTSFKGGLSRGAGS